MTANGTYMTFQVLNDRGYEKVRPAHIRSFDLRVNGPDQPRGGSIHASFADENGLRDGLVNCMNNDPVSIVVNFENGDYAQYKNAKLTSFNYGISERDINQLHTSWVYTALSIFAENPPDERAIRRASRRCRARMKSTKRQMQKLDWLKLGF